MPLTDALSPGAQLLSADFRVPLETIALLDEAFEELTAEQRAVLALHYVGGLATPEVARTLRIPEGTAKSRLAAGLARLRAILQDER
jgi:RNA polymerase sigma factor (sigma-70 family)